MDATDEELVARTIATNDRKAYGLLVRRHQGRVRSWLRQLTGDGARADDLAQDTFIQARDKLTTFTGKGKFSSWLLTIAYRQFLQELRDAKRVERLATRVGEQNEVLELNMTQTSGSGLPDLPKMLSILSDEERAAMILCHAFSAI